MRVHELLEQSSSQQDPNIASSVSDISSAQDIADILENECEKFIQSYKATGVYLYRGIKELSASLWGVKLFIHANIRKNRNPVFMGIDKHNLINDAMKNLGLKAHRGNSIFCSTNKDIATDWGKVYLIFVKDGWNCTYFKKIKKDYAFDDLYHQAHNLTTGSSLSYNERLDIMTGTIKDLNPVSFNNSNGLNLLLSQQYEDIIFSGSKYYGLDISSDAGKKLTNEVFHILGLNPI